MTEMLTVTVPHVIFEKRPVSFVLASTDYGAMILNRHDTNTIGGSSFGVGDELLKYGKFSTHEVQLYLRTLSAARRIKGDGVVALDIGANIGAVTVQLARHIAGWGQVISFEPQARLFQALCGNIVLGNLFNAHPMNVAVGAVTGKIAIPELDHQQPASFGSLQLLEDEDADADVGQTVNYSDGLTVIDLVNLDNLRFPRLDFMKVDVEKMELEVLMGAKELITEQRPVIAIENWKVGETEIDEALAKLGYTQLLDLKSLVVALPDGPNWEDELEIERQITIQYVYRKI